jgi:hypothetical protein
MSMDILILVMNGAAKTSSDTTQLFTPFRIYAAAFQFQ